MPHLEAENVVAVGVIDGGTMGQGIVQSFTQAALSVSVVDLDKGKLDGCLTQMDANLKLFQEFGLLQEDIPSIKPRIHRDIGAQRATAYLIVTGIVFVLVIVFLPDGLVSLGAMIRSFLASLIRKSKTSSP